MGKCMQVRVVFLGVYAEVLFPCESFSAAGAFVRSFSGVDSLVSCEVSGLSEALPALLTTVRSFSSVNAHVCVQTLRRGETLAADRADEVSLAGSTCP